VIYFSDDPNQPQHLRLGQIARIILRQIHAFDQSPKFGLHHCAELLPTQGAKCLANSAPQKKTPEVLENFKTCPENQITLFELKTRMFYTILPFNPCKPAHETL
jgi:hypothetical protein